MDERSFQRQEDGSWTTGARLGASQEPAEVVVRRASGVTTRAHVRAALEFLEDWEQVQRALEPALFAFYCRIEAEMTDYGPDIASADEVWRGVDLREVEIYANEDGHAEYVHGVGGCSWEEEHGLEVVLRGSGELLYVGAYEGWVHGEPPSDHEWNFALPQNQADALANRRISDAELVEVALNVQPVEVPTFPIPSSKAPWWRFW
jgi:hypothetical protein